MPTDTNANLAAAIAGIAMAVQETQEKFNDDTSNYTSSDSVADVVETEVKAETSIDNNESADADAELEGSLNDSEITVLSHIDTEARIDRNPNSDESKNVDAKLEDSFDNKSDNKSFNPDDTEFNHRLNHEANTNFEANLEKSPSGSSVAETYNGDHTDLGVEIERSFNHDDSANIDTKIEDAFNESDTDWLDLDDLNFDVMQTIGAALNGSGNDNAFSLAQVSEMNDSDSLTAASGSISGLIGQLALQEGGTSDGVSDHNVAHEAGKESEVVGSASSAADAHLEALNQNISMGANIQYNTMNISVVGGDGSMDDS